MTDQHLDAALGELGVVAREQPCLLVGDFNVEPTGSRQMEVHRAKQHLTRVGYTAARMRPHRAVQPTLGGLLRNTGAHVDRTLHVAWTKVHGSNT